MSKDRPKAIPATISCSIDRNLNEAALQGCPECQGHLQLHQPEMEHPHRLLATCSECGTWWFLDELPRTGEMVRIRLPSSQALAKLIGPSRKPKSRPSPALDEGSPPGH